MFRRNYCSFSSESSECSWQKEAPAGRTRRLRLTMNLTMTNFKPLCPKNQWRFFRQIRNLIEDFEQIYDAKLNENNVQFDAALRLLNIKEMEYTGKLMPIVQNFRETLQPLPHSVKPKPTVHGRLTPSKILLDRNLVPKITGFGLIMHSDHQSDTKPDVMAFGVLLLHLLTGRNWPGLLKAISMNQTSILSGR
ncbi:unnamed protein product [Microthlaspi erraticum]|uniref:RING-type E3 ubiquitin transferase n=1 Tax=Microthlaspi erraticum TaxID=1685480 RepID=A0A6D2IQ02_9BRAS|nr:unnamed protein product [Microthlaspi erraticum]